MEDKRKHLTYYMFRVSRFFKEKSDVELAKHNLHPGQGRILMLLLRRGNLMQNEIAEIIKRKPATVTNLIKKLEKVGFVLRTVDKADKRIINVSLTSKGKEQALITHNIFQKTEDDIEKSISKKEFEILYNSLKNLYTTFGLDEK